MSEECIFLCFKAPLGGRGGLSWVDDDALLHLTVLLFESQDNLLASIHVLEEKMKTLAISNHCLSTLLVFSIPDCRLPRAKA